MGWGTDRRNRKIANQGKEVIVTVTVADSFSDLDLVVEALELAGADWVDGMGSQTGEPFFFLNCKPGVQNEFLVIIIH